MNEQPNFGPYSKWESVAAFASLSDKAFTLFDDLVERHWTLLSRPVHHLFLRMAYQAKTTSLSIKLCNSWALCLPAFALTRVRLEQTIISSYLIHEDESVGLSPFVQFIPIGQHKAMRVVMEDPALAKELAHINVSAIKAEAGKAQQDFAPNFTISNDKFERKWTKLDLRSMAKKRDALVKGSALIFKESLERQYISVYVQASSIVHADSSSLSYSFLDLFKTPEGGAVLMAVPSWALIVAATTASYDILQCYEILEWLGVAAGDEYRQLMDEWVAARDKYITDERPTSNSPTG